MNEIHESILIPPQRLAERIQFQFLARLTEIGFDYGRIMEIDHVESDCYSSSNASYLTGNEMSKKRLCICPLSIVFEVFEESLEKIESRIGIHGERCDRASPIRVVAVTQT